MDTNASRVAVVESERPPAADANSQEDLHETRQSEPKQSKEQPKDYTSNLIGWILQGGVMLSAGIILIGLLMLPFYGKGLSFSELLTFPRTFGQIWAGLLVLQPLSIIALGL